MLTDHQRKFWKDYIDLIGEENFSIKKSKNGISLIVSKFFCGIDPTDAQGGESMLNFAILRAQEYATITSKDSPTIEDLQFILLSLVEKQFSHLELDKFLPKMLNQIADNQHWELIKNCWTKQEFTTVGGRAEVWRRVLSLRKPSEAVLHKLPSEFIAYRAGDLSGFSWTLDKNVASWFAKRFAANFDEVPIHKKKFSKTNAVMFINDRNEKEVVILPKGE